MSKLTSDDTFITKAEDRYRDMKPQTFDIGRFQMENAAEHFEAVMSFFRARNIDEETVRTFLPFIMRVTDTEAQYKYRDLAFPYTKPGSEKIEGFELRGYNNSIITSVRRHQARIAVVQHGLPTSQRNSPIVPRMSISSRAAMMPWLSIR